MRFEPLFERRLSAGFDYVVFDLRRHADLVDRSGLDETEASRAARFASDTVRRRFVIQRQILRSVLGERLGCDPGQISYAAAATGKPILGPSMGGHRLKFNISHSEHIFAVALSDAEIGIDVELDARGVDVLQVLRLAATGSEHNAVEKLPAAVWHQAVKRLWVAKEAALKLLGVGLQADLKSFTVPARLLDIALPRLADQFAVSGKILRLDYEYHPDAGAHIACCTFSASLPNNSRSPSV